MRVLLALAVCASGCGVGVVHRDADTPPVDGGPTIQILVATDGGERPFPVTFTAVIDGGTAPYLFTWDFGDGQTSSEPEPTHTFHNEGSFQVRVRVDDVYRRSGEHSIPIYVTGPRPDLIVSGLDAVVFADNDPYEPNDTGGYALGAPPGRFVINDARIDERHIEYTVTVRNEGTVRSLATGVDVYVQDPDAAADASASVRALDPSEEDVIVAHVRNAPPGDHRSWARADPQDVVDEYTNGNNLGGNLDVPIVADVDCFRFSRDKDKPIDVILDLLPHDYDLFLFIPNGYYLSGNGGTSPDRVTIDAPETAMYRACVVGYDGVADSSAAYRLTVDITDPPPPQ